MTASGPLVSVIVPAFNAEATLAETLRSALAQTHAHIEVIVVDDGSTDATAAIAARMAAEDPRLTLIRTANHGLAAARNAAIAASRGAYVAPLDADDLWHPAKIERQLAAAAAAPEPPGFVYCWLRTIDAGGVILGSGARHRLRGRIIHRHLYKNVVGTGSGMLMSRAALAEAGGYDERPEGREDYLLQLRLASRHPVEFVPEYLVGYRLGPGRMSGDWAKMMRGWTVVRALLRETCPGVAHDADRWIHGRQYYYGAVERALRRRYLSAAGLLLRAARWDPLWTLGSLRLLLARRFGRRRAPEARIAFADADPQAEIAMDPYENSRAAAWLRRLNARRLARLAKLDEDYQAFPGEGRGPATQAAGTGPRPAPGNKGA
jgi:glycosyltransferase involved in cell wall biosynthesis